MRRGALARSRWSWLWLGLSVAAYLPPGRPRHKDAPLDHTVVLRLIAAWLYERSGSILRAIALRAAWNTATTLTFACIYVT